MKRVVPDREAVERAARMYRTSDGAAQALGITASARGFPPRGSGVTTRSGPTGPGNRRERSDGSS